MHSCFTQVPVGSVLGFLQVILLLGGLCRLACELGCNMFLLLLPGICKLVTVLFLDLIFDFLSDNYLILSSKLVDIGLYRKKVCKGYGVG